MITKYFHSFKNYLLCMMNFEKLQTPHLIIFFTYFHVSYRENCACTIDKRLLDYMKFHYTEFHYDIFQCGETCPMKITF